MAPKGPIKLDPAGGARYEEALRTNPTRRAAADALGIGTGALDHACDFYGLKPGKLLGTGITRAPVAAPVAFQGPPALILPSPKVSKPPPDESQVSEPAEEGSAEPGRDTLTTVLFDAHIPEHDRPGFDAWLRWCRAERPDEIVLSEIAEWLSCSQHGGGAWGSSWERDKADVRRGLIQIRSVNPDARIVWQESNHDTRLTRILEQRLPSFAGSLTIAQELGFDGLGIEWAGERTVLRRGAAKIIHGHQLEAGRGGMLPKYHAARAVAMYGEPNVTVVYGHVHREQVYSEACDGGLKRARSVACMRTLRPAWHRATEMGHHNQFAALYVSAGGGTNVYAVDVQGGAFTFGGKQYRAA
jgi:hypothetical protein